MAAEDVSMDAVNTGEDWESGTEGLLRCPVVVRALPAGREEDRAVSKMGGMMPSSDLTVRAIAELNGQSPSPRRRSALVSPPTGTRILRTC